MSIGDSFLAAKFLIGNQSMGVISNIPKKQKFLVALTIGFLVLTAVTLISLFSFSSTQNKLEKVTLHYQPKMLSAMQLTTHFYHSLSVLGNYMVEQDDHNISLYLEKVQDIDETLETLLELTNENDELDDAEQLKRIKKLVQDIKKYNESLIALAKNVNQNMPAIGLASELLEPLGFEMNQQLSDMLMLAEQSKNASHISHLDTLRFNWNMNLSEVRRYLAFRNPATLDDIDLFINGVKQSLAGIRLKESALDSDIVDLLDEFEENHERYTSLLSEVIQIHSGQEWREDSLLMRQSITPTLRALTYELESLVMTQQERIKRSNEELSNHIQQAEDTIHIAIQVALGIIIITVLLLLRNSLLKEEIKTQISSKKKFMHEASHDKLTNLPNRAKLLEHLSCLINKESNFDLDSFALLFIDLDGFKSVNDTIGHDAGDYVLVESANRFQSVVRKQDFVARLGGDEFIVIIEGEDNVNNVDKIATNLCACIKNPFEFKSNQLEIGCSIGITLSSHIEHQLSLEDKLDDLMNKADKAMYRAKKAGKNQWHFYQPSE